MPWTKVAEGRGKRQHRNLHHVVFVRVSVDESERLGMDQILGVVRDHDVKLSAVVLFKKQHALVDPVEAVGFGGGAVMGADRQMDVREARFQVADGVERRVVVRVGSNKEMIVIVVNGGRRCAPPFRR